MKYHPFLLLATSLSFAIIFTSSCSEDGNVIDSIHNSGASDVWDGRINTSWYKSSQKEFTLTTAQQLAGLAKLVNDDNNFAGKTIKLGKDIYLSNIEWAPIGNCDFGFTGIFDGNGYKIIGVSVNNPDSACQGLFGGLDYSGEIKKLGVVDSYIKGLEFVGGLAGYNNGKISDCYFTGNVAGDSVIGGFVGNNNEGTINRSYSMGAISGLYQTGGFVGTNDGEISNSYSTAAVSGDSIVGGFVGVNFVEISNSYSTGTVRGDTVVGGFVGWNNVASTMSDNYSTGRVSGYINVGGFVGFNSGEISNSYSTGTVSGLAGISKTPVVLGGFAGGNRTGIGSIISNSYYDKEKNSQIENYGGTGKTTAQMKEQATYIDWDFSKIWGLNSTINSGYPYLRSVVGR